MKSKKKWFLAFSGILAAYFLFSFSFSPAPRPIAGLTVIIHGFTPTGHISQEWINMAKAVRKKAGKGSIYINNLETGQWQSLDHENTNNPNDEIIYLYDWAWASNNIKNGYLEASADHLLALMVSPPSEMSGLTADKLLRKPLHLIGHSRGCVLGLRLAYKMGYYFKDKPQYNIGHFTLLDPHPASPMGDCQLEGIVGDCPKIKNYTHGQVYLKLPMNVERADNYYRNDDVYEEVLNHQTFGAYDGVPVSGLDQHNMHLNDSLLSAGSPFFGGAHGVIATSWYYGTLDLGNFFGHDIKPHWFTALQGYPKMGPKEKTGYYHSRLGGGEMPKKIAKEFKTVPQKPTNFIANGSFEINRALFREHIPGWERNGGGGGGILEQESKGNIFLRLEPDHSLLTAPHLSKTHSLQYFPEKIEGKDYGLSFSYKAHGKESFEGNTFLVEINIPATGKNHELARIEIDAKKDSAFKTVFCPLPKEAKGKAALLSFKLLNPAGKTVSGLDLDDINLAPLVPVSVKKKSK